MRSNVVIHPVASPETPDLPNIKGSVFEVTHNAAYDVAPSYARDGTDRHAQE